MPAGHAATVCSQQKFDTYASVMAPTNTLIPFVIEHYGRLGPHAHALLAMLARVASERTAGSKSTSGCLQQLRQLVSVTTQRVIADSIQRLWARTRPAPGQGAINLLAFSRQPLLLRLASSQQVLATGLPGWEGLG